MDEIRNKLETRLRELEQARERYLAEVQRQIGAFDGAIAELRRLLEGTEREEGLDDETSDGAVPMGD